MNKKVLITVSGGVPTAFADHGVDVIIVDLDDAKDTVPNELDPIHSDFLPLMKFAKATNAWPVSDNGRKSDAAQMEPSKSDLKVNLTFKPLTESELTTV
jgi:hypothetical protein